MSDVEPYLDQSGVNLWVGGLIKFEATFEKFNQVCFEATNRLGNKNDRSNYA
jgi:hypothetical protein